MQSKCEAIPRLTCRFYGTPTTKQSASTDLTEDILYTYTARTYINVI